MQERGLWEIRTAIEGFAVGGEKDGHGPAASAGHCLNGIHVNGVHVWPFFAIYFDVDKQLVHYCCGLDVFKAFVCHDVAPMAGRVTHRKQDGNVATFGHFKGLFTPRIPVDRVVTVLAQIWAGFIFETISHKGFLCGKEMSS